MVTDSNSVHERITRLCEKLLKERTPVSPLERRSSYVIVKDLRALSYEVLLNKSNSPCSVGVEEGWDAMSEILAYSYTLHQHHMTSQAMRLYDLVDNLLDTGWRGNPTMEAILLFLTNLAGEVSCSPEETNNIVGITNKAMGFRTFKMPFNIHVKPYTEFHPQIFEPPYTLEVYKKRAYTSAGLDFPFNQEPGSGLSLLGKFGYLMPVKQKQRFLVEFHTFPDLTKPRDLIIPKETFCLEQQDEGYGSPSQDNSMTVSCLTNNEMDSVGNEIWQLALGMDLPNLRTWETFGTLAPPPEMPFLTESTVDCVEKVWKYKKGQMHMYINASNASDTLLQTLSRKQLVQDLKFLLVGLPSQTFQYNEGGDGFVMKNNIYVEGLTPGTLHSFCKDFLTSGTCCLRLGKLTACNIITGSYVQEGLIFQALCRSIRRYLQFYRGAIMLLPENSGLIRLRQQFDGLCIQIACLGRLCKVHPNTTQEETLPEGVALLAYLYQEICKVTRKDVACILYSALRACCQVYFSFLQKWMFEGSFQDTYTEFFIQEQPDMVTCRKREYWNQAFYMLDEAVPGFLRGLEGAVYHCGKAVNLLKLCNPQDPLCVILQSGYPAVQCCLHSVDIQKLEEECLSYKHRAMNACGEPLVLSNLFQSSQEEERALQISIQAAQQERLQKLKLERDLEASQVAAKKSAELAMLREQMELREMHKEEERRQQLEEDKQREREAQELKEEMSRLTEMEKTDLMDYYAAVTEVAEKRRQHAEWRVERMKLQDKRLELQYNTIESVTVIRSPNNNEHLQDINRNLSDISETNLAKTENSTLETDVIDPQNNARQENTVDVENNAHQTDIIDTHNIALEINVPDGINNREFQKAITSLKTSISNTQNSMETSNKDLEQGIIKPRQGHSASLLTSSPVKFAARTQSSELKTEAERNLKKVMNSKYNILTGELWSCGKIDTVKEPDIGMVLEPRNLQSVHSLDDMDTESTTSFKTASSITPIQSGTLVTESSTLVYEQAQRKLSITERRFSYTVEMSVADTPLVNITNNSLQPIKQSTAGSSSDMTSITIALQKSILIPLKIQTSLVNNALLKFFIQSEELISHLRSLRSYFFLLDGEFGRNVTDALFERTYEVMRPVDLLNCVTLNSILSKALTQADPNSDRLSFDVKSIPPHFSFSSPRLLDPIVLRYKVTWPLNIIITNVALEKYDEVFRFLLSLRRISWVLEEDFHCLKRAAKDRPSLSCSPQYHQVQLHRHEMTHFVHAFQNYVTATVLQGSWVKFLQNLQNAQTLDELYRMHVAYVKMVLFRCLLHKQSNAFQKSLHETLRMILKFHGQLRSQTWQIRTNSSHYQHPKFSTLVQIYNCFHNMAAFTFKYATKLASTGYQPYILELLQILNMNGFYQDNF